MSYSRWAESHFYTYWHSAGVADPKAEQRFVAHLDIEHQFCVTYKELLAEDSLVIANRIINLYMDANPTGTTGPSSELAKYLDQFMLDVEATFTVDVA